MEKYCPKCGTTNSEDVQSCSSCGAFLISKSQTIAKPIIPKTSGMAIAALVLGILTLGFAIFTGLPAIILGIIALGNIEKSGGRLTGKGFAIAGIVTPFFLIALRMAIFMPALSRVRDNARCTICKQNLKVLTNGWEFYSNDNNGRIVNGVAGQNRFSWTGRDWITGDLLPESEQIQAIKSGTLWEYVRFEDRYRCPAGLSGHLRTFSIVDSMNGIAREGTKENQGAYVTSSLIVFPHERLVFIDVGQIIPETYAVYYNQRKWWDQPPVHHYNGTTVSFMDGHVEYWKWIGTETNKRGKAAKSIHNPDVDDHWSPQTLEGNKDLIRIQVGTWGRTLGY
jgi:prepilin-type processing-associated H-X9-DG protein